MTATALRRSTAFFRAGPAFALVAIVYLHNTLPALTMMPRVNVDEPWLMERAWQVMHTGSPSQPMLGLHHAYLLQVGYGYLLAIWMALAGVGLWQARLLGVALGFGIVALVAWIGLRTIGPVAAVAAALFLALDSNFLGGARNARTDIPSVFFATGALAAYLAARYGSRPAWFAGAGASLGLAMLCHGNAFWAGLILVGWFLLDDGLRTLARPYVYRFAAGVLLTFGPYLAVVLARWREVQVQIGNFAADRLPGWRPSFVLHQMMQEPQRYRGWYFGLVTSLVPNPLLWVFKIAVTLGILMLLWRVVRRGTYADARGPARLLMLVAGSVLIFAGFINNKVPVYMPHLLVGFALAAGFAVSEIVSAPLGGPANPPGPLDLPGLLALLFVLGYGGAGVAYYEKWYATVRKSELVPFEQTEATLRALVPPGPKYVFASPQFWPPFHAEPRTTFYSYAAAWPIDARPEITTLTDVGGDRPIFLVVDELQWLPELTATPPSSPAWQRGWVDFIRRRCALDAVAFGTAHGTMALYRCALTSAPAATRPEAPPITPPEAPRIIGGSTEYAVADPVLIQSAADLARWARYDDPRRTPAARPSVESTARGLRIHGTGWPGIVKMVEATPGDRYLVSTATARTRDGDLLYLGTWQQPQVRSLAGASSSGIPAPLLLAAWFPRDRAFIATAPAVQVRVYSEAPETDFLISSLTIARLQPVSGAAVRR
jgi:4-amino-4-deoxy-L-arabinose transferase-like glycosyltransferase